MIIDQGLNIVNELEDWVRDLGKRRLKGLIHIEDTTLIKPDEGNFGGFMEIRWGEFGVGKESVRYVPFYERDIEYEILRDKVIDIFLELDQWLRKACEAREVILKALSIYPFNQYNESERKGAHTAAELINSYCKESVGILLLEANRYFNCFELLDAHALRQPMNFLQIEKDSKIEERKFIYSILCDKITRIKNENTDIKEIEFIQKTPFFSFLLSVNLDSPIKDLKEKTQELAEEYRQMVYNAAISQS